MSLCFYKIVLIKKCISRTLERPKLMTMSSMHNENVNLMHFLYSFQGTNLKFNYKNLSYKKSAEIFSLASKQFFDKANSTKKILHSRILIVNLI